MKEHTIKELVGIYNELTGENIKRFATKEVAIRRIEEARSTLKKQGKPTEEVAPKKKFLKFEYPTSKVIKPHREKTARAVAISMLLKGATFEEVAKETGWEKGGTRMTSEGIRLLHKHLGYGISTDENGTIKLLA